MFDELLVQNAAQLVCDPPLMARRRCMFDKSSKFKSAELFEISVKENFAPELESFIQKKIRRENRRVVQSMDHGNHRRWRRGLALDVD